MQKIIFSLTLCVVFAASISLAEQFAPKVDVPEEMLESSHEAYERARSARDAEIPSQEEVGIPAAPEAKILLTQKPTTWEVNGKNLQTLDRIYMASTQPVERVVSFYKTNLADWGYENRGGVHYFWKGNGDFDPYGESGVITPRVVVGEPFKHRKHPLMPDMQSTIEVFYKK